MNLDLDCLEWTNTNKSARFIKTGKKSKQKNPNDDSSSIYIIQISPSRVSKSKIACLTSDQFIAVYDQNTLKMLNQFKALEDPKKTVSEIGFYKKSDEIVFACSDNGTLKTWDLRLCSGKESKESLCFKTDDNREFLSADINSDDNYFVVGTNKNIDDALVYIYDVRMSDKYLHKFAESHSEDVSQVKFDPYRSSKFCSGSLDGLVCLYDLNQQPEQVQKIENNNDNEDDDDASDGEEDPDLMEQVFNTDSSVHKLGYISSSCTTSDQLYAITLTNDLFVWDLNTHDIIYKHQSKNKNIINGTAIDDAEDQEEDYFFDCFYIKPELMTICKGDKNGSLKIYNKNDVMYDSLVESETENGLRRSHRDVIRSSYWNGENFYTAGEDGFLFKWKLIDKNARSIEIDDTKKSQKRELSENDESEDEHDDKRTNKKQSQRSNKNKSFYSKFRKNK